MAGLVPLFSNKLDDGSVMWGWACKACGDSNGGFSDRAEADRSRKRHQCPIPAGEQ